MFTNDHGCHQRGCFDECGFFLAAIGPCMVCLFTAVQQLNNLKMNSVVYLFTWWVYRSPFAEIYNFAGIPLANKENKDVQLYLTTRVHYWNVLSCSQQHRGHSFMLKRRISDEQKWWGQRTLGALQNPP